MPYRLKPKDKTVVQKKEKSRWVKLKKHGTVAQAMSHLHALGMNVSKKERK